MTSANLGTLLLVSVVNSPHGDVLLQARAKSTTSNFSNDLHIKGTGTQAVHIEFYTGWLKRAL
jgi:hypothetical protein